MVRATVREWHDDLGWGVLDSSETPGGCWAHFSSIDTGDREVYRSLRPGQVVDLDTERPGQDGYDFWARTIRP